MKHDYRKTYLICLISVLFYCFGFAQSNTIGGYNVYYGDLHNHTGYSNDAKLTPRDAYEHAKNTAKLDFFGLSDHAWCLTQTEWLDTKKQAIAASGDNFIGFWGFEWTSNTYGHLSIFGTDEYCTRSAPNTFTGIVDWMSDNTEGVAFFNHPGYATTVHNSNQEFEHFETEASNEIVGMELWNASSEFNYHTGESGFHSDYHSYFGEANNRGWKVGATGAGDEHKLEWGTRFDSRMAILAPNLTRESLLSAMEARRFYSTLDKNLRLSFKIGGAEMGSSIWNGTKTFQIQTSDANSGDRFTEVVVYNQNNSVVKKYTLNSNSSNNSFSRKVIKDEYYYVKVTQADGDMAISSPIWVSYCSGETVYANSTYSANKSMNSDCDIRIYNVIIQNNSTTTTNARSDVILQNDVEVKIGSQLYIY